MAPTKFVFFQLNLDDLHNQPLSFSSKSGVNFINILGTTLYQYFCAKKLHSPNVTREKLCKAL